MSEMLVNAAVDNFGRLKRSLRNHYVHARPATGLTLVQLELLQLIQELEPVASKQLAERLGTSAGAVSQHLDLLDRKQCITRTTSQNDRRVDYISLSREGKHYLQSYIATRRKYFAKAFAELSDEELTAFIATQDKIITWFETNPPKET